MSRNFQVVVLATDEGTARDESMLEQVWKKRLEEVAPHYKLLSAKILRKRDE